MYRHPSDDHLKGRVWLHAWWQVVVGSVFVVGGILGFIASRDWGPLGLVVLGTFSVLYWNPVRKKYDDNVPHHKDDDFFPGGKL